MYTDKWDFAHTLLTVALWIRMFRNWLLLSGAQDLDFEDGALDAAIIRAVIERSCQPPPDIPPASGRPTRE